MPAPPLRPIGGLALLACTCLALACVGCPRQVQADLPYRTGTIARHPDGSFRKGLLVAPTVVEGWPCRDWVHVHAEGTLRGIELDAPATRDGIAFPAGSFLWFRADGSLETAWLAEDVHIQGHACRGGAGKVATGFHPDGSLASFSPREPVTLDGLRCRPSLLAPVRLHPSGRLAGCALDEEARVDGRLLPAGTRIRLDAEGHLERVED